MSFDHGMMLWELKQALIMPLLKKLGLGLEILKHFRPVNNLTYLSQMTERVAAKRLLNCMWINVLDDIFSIQAMPYH